ncbi:MAG: MoaD/ThiS family protein [Actinomycetota bacterium]|jgi:molybdopterin converting factor small subunit|nr:MoaD/ThiS family protein [Actinomycetota bacterium]
MSVLIRIPGALRQFTDNARTIEVDVPADSDVAQVLAALGAENPALGRRICDEQGAVRQHVNVFVGTVNVRDGDGLATRVPDGAELYVLPAVSGG